MRPLCCWQSDRGIKKFAPQLQAVVYHACATTKISSKLAAFILDHVFRRRKHERIASTKRRTSKSQSRSDEIHQTGSSHRLEVLTGTPIENRLLSSHFNPQSAIWVIRPTSPCNFEPLGFKKQHLCKTVETTSVTTGRVARPSDRPCRRQTQQNIAPAATA